MTSPVRIEGHYGSDNLATAQVSVGASATLIVPSNPGRRAVLIVQHGSTDVFIGGSSVGTGTGLLLPGTKGAALSIPGTMAIYGIVGAGTQTVSYLEQY